MTRRQWISQLGDELFRDERTAHTLFVFSVVTCLLGGTVGILLAESPEFTRAVVRGIAWIKGLSLDEKLYGITRGTHWEGRLQAFGAMAGPAGIGMGLALLLVRRSRHRAADSIRAGVFLLSLLLAFAWREKIELPFSNPWEIVGRTSLAGHNPATPIVQFLLLALLPALSVGIVDLLWMKGTKGAGTGEIPAAPMLPQRSRITTASIALLIVLVSGNVYTWHEQKPLDTFHEGETLGPAVRWEQGQAPYRDIVIVHGPFHDPIRSVLAFTIFGRSIAAARTMESLLEILAFILFVGCTYAVFRRSLIEAGLAIAVMVLLVASRPFDTGITIPHRDIVVCLFLLSMLALYRRAMAQSGDRPSGRISFLLFASSCLPFVGLAYSVDRGSYLVLAWVTGIAMLHGGVGLQWHRAYVLALAAGVLGGVVCLGLSVRWAYADFLTHAFRILPSVHGLGFSLPYPFDTTAGRVPLVLTAFNASWLVHCLVTSVRSTGSFKQGRRDFLRAYYVEALLFVVSVLLFLSALGRAGIDHIHYSSGFTFLLTLSIVIQRLGKSIVNSVAASAQVRRLVPVAMVAVGAYVASGTEFSMWYRFPLGAPDEAAIGRSYQTTVSFLRDSLEAERQFATLTSEGVWEYFLGRTSPTRFSIVGYALPSFYQEEVVRDLREGPVEYLIYKNDHWANAIDGIPWEDRLPGIANYVRERYEPYRTFDDQQVWRLKGVSGN